MALYSDLNYIKPSKGDRLYDIDTVFQSIFSIMGTKKGERVFRPDFGLNMKSYLFEPCDEFTARSIFYDLRKVMEWEPRIKLNTSKTTVTPVPDKNLFLITIWFSVLGFTKTEKSLNLVLKVREKK